MATKHGTAFAFALEAAQNAEICLNDKDLEFFLCSVIDGEKVYIEFGGNINNNIINGLESFLAKLKEKKDTTGIYSYSTEVEERLKEVASGLI
ncbi:hypothetical protein MTZ49_07120 [Entomomonas sp. E2T0]|uniref:hypothetical protein n=1 Tax=Entomomonas sp. E2T0 TaxID=2930213 RepID=UPI0022282042|nr:hypothetical protein [Entomomonas sp. E2T0]UYZ85309.1 hypothetical protein MTZ49_07120 [Entomomonas sp. E2T0]